MRPRLADLVAPQSVNDFIQTTYGRSWVRHEGDRRRFHGLANWETLNSILAIQRFESSRFRLVRKGEITLTENYTQQVWEINGTCYQRIIVDRLLRELRSGSSLIIDRVDQAHEPIRELAATLGSELKASVFVSIVASWMPVPGFDTHWDDHDVLVIQLEGRKHWKIFKPTRNWPLPRDVAENTKLESPPVAEFDMTAGDVLYVPHGWWHSVSALGEPSLHLTVGISPDNGIDFMTWLVDRARHYEIFRKRIPRFEDEDQRKEYLTSVRSRWNELMAPDDILDQFLTYADGTSLSLPLFGLPDILNNNTVLNKKNARIVLLAARATVIPTADGGFILTALGRRWTFPSMIKPLIDAVLSRDHVTIEEAIRLNVGVSEEQSAQVIFKLLRAGVLALQ